MSNNSIQLIQTVSIHYSNKNILIKFFKIRWNYLEKTLNTERYYFIR